MIAKEGQSDGRDAGFTLVELMVYSILLIVVMGIAAVVFVRVINAQTEIKGMAEANNEAQVLFTELELDLRNAAWVEAYWGGDLLVMQTRSATPGDDASYICAGYYYDEVDQTMHRTRLRQTAAEADGSVGDIRAAASQAEARTIAQAWPSRDDVGPIGSDPVFAIRYESGVVQGVAASMQANISDVQKPIEFAKLVGVRPQLGISGGCA